MVALNQCVNIPVSWDHLKDKNRALLFYTVPLGYEQSQEFLVLFLLLLSLNIYIFFFCKQ